MDQGSATERGGVRSRSWKAAETRFARDVGSERKPCDGSRAGADFEDGIACYQLKVRRSIPGWLWDWLSGIQGNAQSKGKAGVLVLKAPRQQDEDALVVLSWKHWVELHGKPKVIEKGKYPVPDYPFMNCLDCNYPAPLYQACPNCGLGEDE